MSKTAVSLRPASMRPTIESLITQGATPPKKTSEELDRLDYNNSCGMHVVREVLKTPLLPSVSYRELSRYATHLAITHLRSLAEVMELESCMSEYRTAKSELEFRLRKFYDDSIEGAKRGYQPISRRANVHIWFWDESDKEQFLGVLEATELPSCILYPFTANALSDIAPRAMSRDCLAEYDVAYRFIRCFLVTVKSSSEDCSKLFAHGDG